jgi:hypothetical protein
MKTITALAKVIVWLLWTVMLIATFLYQKFLVGGTAVETTLFAVFPLGMLI